MWQRERMTGSDGPFRLTASQAIVRYLMHQCAVIVWVKTRICGAGSGIFGHGNVPCLNEAGRSGQRQGV